MTAAADETSTNRGSTLVQDRGTVRSMKPFIIFGLWAVLGLDAGAWAEAVVGMPAVVGVIICVGIGAVLAVEARRQMAARAARGPQVAIVASPFDVASTLDRAA